MSQKLPQSNTTLVKRLRRVAKWLDATTAGQPEMAARANTCWQCAARIDELSRVLGLDVDDLEADDPYSERPDNGDANF